MVWLLVARPKSQDARLVPLDKEQAGPVLPVVMCSQASPLAGCNAGSQVQDGQPEGCEDWAAV